MSEVIHPLFSIVIPVYNGRTNNLERCLNSIWKQNIEDHNIEVVCIDDCSNDDSREWLKSIMLSHSNLILIENSTNIRQGGSRNRGVMKARGKYVMFIDQDDYFHENSFELIRNEVEKNDLDILVVSNSWELSNRRSDKIQGIKSNCELMSGLEYLTQNGPVFVPWKLIFRKDYVVQKSIFMRENVKLGEDIDWTFKMFFKAKRVKYAPILHIHYVRGKHNTSNETNRTQIFYACEEIFNTVNKEVHDENIKHIAYQSIEYFLKSTILNMFFFSGFHDKVNSLKKIGRLYSNPQSFFIIFTLRYYVLFSAITELLSPIGRMFYSLYRSYQVRFVWPKIMY